MSYNNKDVYIRKCKQVNVLPMNKRFVLNDITLFHKIVYNLIPVKLPDWTMINHSTLEYHVTNFNTFFRWLWRKNQNPNTLL